MRLVCPWPLCRFGSVFSPSLIIQLFIPLFILSATCSFIYSLTLCSFIHSFIHSIFLSFGCGASSYPAGNYNPYRVSCPFLWGCWVSAKPALWRWDKGMLASGVRTDPIAMFGVVYLPGVVTACLLRVSSAVSQQGWPPSVTLSDRGPLVSVRPPHCFLLCCTLRL